MTLVPWTGLLDGAVAMGTPDAAIIGSLLIGLLGAASLAVVLGADRKPLRLDPVIALRPTSRGDRAAAA